MMPLPIPIAPGESGDDDDGPPAVDGANAIVPEGAEAIVLPPQAFVAMLPALVGYTSTPAFTSTPQATYIHPNLAGACYSALFTPQTFDFSGCALALGNLVAIASALVALGSGCVANFTGDNETFPETAHVDGVVVIDFTTLPSPIVAVAGGAAVPVGMNNLRAFADSSAMSGAVIIGTQDDPSPEAVAAKYVELFPSASAQAYPGAPAIVPAAVDAVVSITFTDEALYPIATPSANPDTTVLLSAGVAAARHASISALNAAGWTGSYTSSISGITSI